MDNALTASMTHLNAWAIAEGIKEAEAFDALNKERDRLLAELAPEEISSRARRCLDSAA
jgi:hypothetical protein